MSEWFANKSCEEFAVTSDWDNRWRTGGSVDEIVAEAHLDAASLRQGIERFVNGREQRLAKIREV